MPPAQSEPLPPAFLLLLDPAGHRSRIQIQRVPFRMGRQPDCELILRDSRASRNHAQIVLEGGQYILEDAGSRHGVWVNGERVSRRPLRDSDRIEFGFPDSYRVVFISGAAELRELAEHTAAAAISGGPGANLAKLRAILEVARTLQTGFSLNDVLTAVVDAALAITGAERGFLLLRDGDGLDTRVARSRAGARLDPADLRVPRRVIRRALDERRDLFSMNFEPHTLAGAGPEQSIADLELRSCICVPLVRIRTGSPEATSVLDAAAQTAGVLYMDSRLAAADLTGGNRELLQGLAIEASTVLENARLLEEERAKQKMEEELQIARGIQQSLLPGVLPSSGWFRAAGSSVPTHEVGGDYFDVVQVSEDCWSAVAADVSGKGVSSALLAALLQGAFLGVAGRIEGMEDRFARMNRFLNERTGGEKYATVFYCTLDRGGTMHYINAGHCAPVVVRCSGTLETLGPTGMPVGLIDSASFEMRTVSLAPGDKVVIYTDGITEAQGPTGEFFGRKRLREEIRSLIAASCAELHAGILRAVTAFTGGAPQSDDLTLVVLEYRLP